MEITVGTDTYISLEDANIYIENSYMATESQSVAWGGISDDDRMILLKRAAQTIDRQPLIGLRATSTQVMEFPRATYTDGGYNNDSLRWGDDYYTQTAVPTAVKYAQVELALSLLSGVSNRVDLQRQGVKSFSLGKLSESYSGKTNALPYTVRDMMSQYLLGGAPIC